MIAATNGENQNADVLGVPVNTLSIDDTIVRLTQLIESDSSHIVVTADSSGIAMAQSDPVLMDIYRRASWVTCDSYGVVWAIRRKGISVERVSGVDVADRLMKLSAEKGYRVFLLGAEPGIASAAAEALALKYPGCNVVGTQHGHFPASDDRFIAEKIAESKPDILLVAMGIPRQEKFIAETLEIVNARISLGVGGTLDVFSGRAKRAPLFVQRMKLEWLWRLILNPKKWRKAMMLPVFARMVLRERKK